MGVSPSSYAKKSIGAIVVLILGIALYPTVVTEVQNLNSSLWTFTGHSGAATLVSLVPFLYGAGILLGAGMAFLNINMVVLVRKANNKINLMWIRFYEKAYIVSGKPVF